MDNHPYYIQNLAHELWNITDSECSKELIREAVSNLLDQNNYLFQVLTDNLTNTQISFLKALCAGVTSFTSLETLKSYDLGSVSNIRRIRDALIHKDIIDAYTITPEFLDPLFKMWFVQKIV